MIAAFSTSSPLTSVALIAQGRVLFAREENAQGRAGEACLRLFEEGLRLLDFRREDVRIFAADVGPGSFTGVRVGIVVAKTLAWAQGVRCAGADAFDLVSPERTVSLPSRKGEWFVRLPGCPPERTRETPLEVGVPRASGFAGLALESIAPHALMPAYLIEPSISKPKVPFARPA